MTAAKILANEVIALENKLDRANEENALLRRKIENHIIMSEDFKAEYNDWLDSLNVEVNDVK